MRKPLCIPCAANTEAGSGADLRSRADAEVHPCGQPRRFGAEMDALICAYRWL